MLPLFAQSYTYNSSPVVSIVAIVFGLAVLGLGIWAVIDASKYDDWIWERAGQNKILWMILNGVIPLIACFCCAIIGLIPVGIYFFVIKKKLDEVKNQGGGYGAGGYGYPPVGGPGGGYAQPPYPPGSGGPQGPATGPYPPGSGGPEAWGGQYPPGSGGPQDGGG